MAAKGVEPVGCPTWVPKDYSLSYIRVLSSDDTVKIFASYVSERSEMFIRVSQFTDSSASEFEKNEGGYTYIHSGIEFDVMTNLDSCNIEWQMGNLIYSITGSLTIDEIESMIYSINLER